MRSLCLSLVVMILACPLLGCGEGGSNAASPKQGDSASADMAKDAMEKMKNMHGATVPEAKKK